MTQALRGSYVLVIALAASAVTYGEEFDVRIYRTPYSLVGPLASRVAEKMGGSVESGQFRNDVAEGTAAFAANDWDGTGLVSGETSGGDSIALSLNDGHKVFWGEDVSMEYLVPRDDGRYDLRTVTFEQGLRVALRRSGEDSSELWLHIDQAAERERIDGVSLDVGPPAAPSAPVWEKRTIRTAVGEWSAIAFSRDRAERDREIVFVFVKANTAYTGPPAETAQAQFAVESKVFYVRGLPEGVLQEAVPSAVVAGDASLVSELRLPDGGVLAGTDWDGLTKAGLETEILSAPRTTVALVGATAEPAAADGTLMRVRVNQSKGGGGGFGGGSGDGQETMDTWLRSTGAVLQSYLKSHDRTGVSVMMDMADAAGPGDGYTNIATAQRVVEGDEGGLELEYVVSYVESGGQDERITEIGAELRVPFAERGAFLVHIPGFSEEGAELFVHVTVERVVD